MATQAQGGVTVKHMAQRMSRNKGSLNEHRQADHGPGARQAEAAAGPHLITPPPAQSWRRTSADAPGYQDSGRTRNTGGRTAVPGGQEEGFKRQF